MRQRSLAYPDERLKVIVDNLNTHKNNEDWLAKHTLVTFHFTPTRASWLNQVEGWFSILQGQSLAGASFNSVDYADRRTMPSELVFPRNRSDRDVIGSA